MMRALMALLLCAGAGSAAAHKPSDSYLTLTAHSGESDMRVQWDIALRDLDLALDLARRNFTVQREPADARVLLETALAADDAAAAQPALAWMRETGIGSVQLDALARRATTGATR